MLLEYWHVSSPSILCLLPHYAMSSAEVYYIHVFCSSITILCQYIMSPTPVCYVFYSSILCIMLQYYYLMSQYTMICAQICYAFCSSITKTHALVYYYVAYPSMLCLLIKYSYICLLPQ